MIPTNKSDIKLILTLLTIKFIILIKIIDNGIVGSVFIIAIIIGAFIEYLNFQKKNEN
jgi:hypothetical protein